MFSVVLDLVGEHPNDRDECKNDEDIEDTWKPCVENARTSSTDICRHIICNFFVKLILCFAKSNYSQHKVLPMEHQPDVFVD
jgi:hypothetical protein